MARQLLSPVVELPFQHLSLQPFPLPLRIIGILYRQRLQGRSRTSAESVIQRVELSQHHSQRPPVRNDVMHHHQQDMVLVPELNQAGTDEWPSGKIEWKPRLLPQELWHFTLDDLNHRHG